MTDIWHNILSQSGTMNIIMKLDSGFRIWTVSFHYLNQRLVVARSKSCIISVLVTSFTVKQHIWHIGYWVSEEHNRYHICWLKFTKKEIGSCKVCTAPHSINKLLNGKLKCAFSNHWHFIWNKDEKFHLLQSKSIKKVPYLWDQNRDISNTVCFFLKPY